jgi:dTDP-4-dehydrorhamnose 3,5-epimerase
MITTPLALDGLWRLRSEPAQDERGAFSRLWCTEDFARAGLAFAPVQVSLSETPQAGALRGLHWQAEPHGETKLMRVLRGRIHDVLVDVRRDRATFGRHVAVELQAGDGLLIPSGLAHGFLTLAADVQLVYAMDRAYEPMAARGLRYDDPDLAIAWPHPPRLVGARDRAWPNFRTLVA